MMRRTLTLDDRPGRFAGATGLGATAGWSARAMGATGGCSARARSRGSPQVALAASCQWHPTPRAALACASRSDTRGLARTRRRALTLLEVIIAVSIMSFLLTALLLFFKQSGEIRSEAARMADRTQVARQVLERIATEIRGCLGTERTGFPVEQRLVGDRRKISFLTTGLPAKSSYRFMQPSEEPPPGAHDLREVAYELWVNDKTPTAEGNPTVGGIIRTEKKTLNQFIVDEEDPQAVRTDLWSAELGFLEFRFFDGVQWDTKWDITEGNSLPQLVMVTVGFKPLTIDEHNNTDLESFPVAEYPFGDDVYHPDRFTTIVRIPAADRFFSSRVQRVGKQFSEQLGVEGSGK
ncbi:hypothetical protein RAS1_40250 [Phycisphaerae bacterium RAS1]|nr:hypothetical protein RAS1_40250 [Phycisphaerae bacterium RAS1]